MTTEDGLWTERRRHYELTEELVRYFGEKRSCQTVCSTHNTSLLRNDVMRPDCIYLIDSERGISHLSDLTERELRTAHNIEKLYRNGEFG